MPAPYARWRRLLDGEALPAAVVDLDALDRNLVAVLALAGDKPVRLATKSLRCGWLLRYLIERGGGRLRGLFAVHAREARLLVELGFDDVLVGYPVGRRADAEALAALAAGGATVRVVADEPAHVDLLGAAARAAGATLGVVVEIDLALRVAGRHLGVLRSPIRGPEAAVALARSVAEAEGLRFDGVLAYEAQIAGVPDRTPGGGPLDRARRAVKHRSRTLVLDRRRRVVEALAEAGLPPALVNGGGTGSLAWTSADPSVTELTAGSGFLAPHGFDGFDGLDLEPAAFFALPVVRLPDEAHVTCLGGGYAASGPPGPDRAPRVHLPAGLEPVSLEGWGEVQTPFRVRGELRPALGDPVIARHAKAGELFAHFAEVLLARGDRVVDRAPTWRGLGL